MTRVAKHVGLTPAADVDQLTDEQRAAIVRFFDDHPDGGYKPACRAAGIRASKAEAKQLIDSDDELADYRERKLGIDEDSAWRRVATIAQDLDHKDALRANTFILAAIHGHTDRPDRLEIVGAGTVTRSEDRSARLTDVAHVLVQAGALAGAALVSGGDAEQALSAARKVLAEPEPGVGAADRLSRSRQP